MTLTNMENNLSTRWEHWSENFLLPYQNINPNFPCFQSISLVNDFNIQISILKDLSRLLLLFSVAVAAQIPNAYLRK